MNFLVWVRLIKMSDSMNWKMRIEVDSFNHKFRMTKTYLDPIFPVGVMYLLNHSQQINRLVGEIVYKFLVVILRLRGKLL